MVRSFKIGLAILLLAGCRFSSGGIGGGSGNTLGDDGDSNDASEGDGTGGTGGSDGTVSADTHVTGMPIPCGGGGACLPAPPAEWSGPVGVGAGPSGGVLQCPAGWSQMLLGNRDLVAPAADCGCDCAQPSAVCQVSYQYYYSNNCNFPLIAGGGTTGGECNGHGSTDTSLGVRVTLEVPEADCAPEDSVTVPAASWNEQVLACTATPGEACDEGSCYENPGAPLDGRFCIARLGEHGCPGGVYQQRELVYSSINDTRGCQACDCSVTGAINCDDGQLAEYDSTSCGGTPSTIAPGGCQSSGISDNIFTVRYSGTQPTVSCSPSTPQSSGAATPADATTFCCTS